MNCESCGCKVTDREEKLAGGHLSWDGCINALKARAEAAEAERDALRAQLDELFGRPEHPPTGEPPAELWLQWYGDDDENYLETEYGYGVTWSQGKVFARDIHYRIAQPQEAAQ